MEFESKIEKINIEDLSVYDLLYYNETIKNIFMSRKEREEKRVKDGKLFIYYEINDLINYRDIIDEKSKLLEKCSLIIYFNCESFKELMIKIILKNEKNDRIISRVLTQVYEYLLKLKEGIKDNVLVKNYLLESFQLSYGYFSGYYDFDKIKIDFGEKQDTYLYPIVVKTKIQYYKIINDKQPTKMIDTLKIDRDILIKLIQVFLRTPFEIISNGKYYGNSDKDFLYELNTSQKGSLINCDRNEIVEFQSKYIYEDTGELFDCFEKLKYEEQNTFLQSCEAYIEGLKNGKGKEVAFFVISMENLANFEYKDDSISKTQKIYNLIQALYDKEIVSKEYIDYIYELRSQYTHLGIANNVIKQTIFDVFENNKYLISEIEKVSYSLLIKWLINKGEKNGK